jgi:integrase/recombinase XerD
MYTKNLRTVFNEADKLKVIKKERYYPFGNGKYVIPSSRNIKKALDLEDIKEIYYYQCPPKLPQVNRSRAFWFFMYFGNGMNPKDLLLLKYKDITGKFLEFERAKTEETLREDPPKISVFLNEDMLKTIEEYGNTDRNPKNYIFPIFELYMAPLRQYHVKEQFVKTVNKWMAYIIKDLGIQRKGTTYVARHSYATVRSRAGATINEIQDELGQVNPKTTKRYIASLESQQKTSNASQLEAFKRLPKTEEVD